MIQQRSSPSLLFGGEGAIMSSFGMGKNVHSLTLSTQHSFANHGTTHPSRHPEGWFWSGQYWRKKRKCYAYKVVFHFQCTCCRYNACSRCCMTTAFRKAVQAPWIASRCSFSCWTSSTHRTSATLTPSARTWHQSSCTTTCLTCLTCE